MDEQRNDQDLENHGASNRVFSEGQVPFWVGVILGAGTFGLSFLALLLGSFRFIGQGLLLSLVVALVLSVFFFACGHKRMGWGYIAGYVVVPLLFFGGCLTVLTLG